MPLSAGRSALRYLCVMTLLAWPFGHAGAQAQTSPAPLAKPAAKAAPKAAPVAQSAIDIDQTIQSLKDEMVQFNRDASAAEDEFLYPAESRLYVYVSSGIPGLMLEHVQVSVDGGAPVDVTYDETAARALDVKGALQRVLRMNIPRGAHRLKASFSGKMAGAKGDGDAVTGQYDALFDKALEPAEIELQIVKGARRGAAINMQIKEWRAAE